MNNPFAHLIRATATSLLLLCAGNAWAQTSSSAQVEVAVGRMLAALASDDARLEQSVTNNYGRDLSPEKRKVVKAMMRSTMGHERMPQYLAQILTPVLTPTLSVKEAQAYLIEGIAALQLRGLARLPTERQAQYLKHMVDMTGAMPASACKSLFLGKFDTRQAALMEQRYNASLPLGAFEAIVNLYRDSSLAELTKYPDARTINAQQAQGAERAHELAVAARVRRLPPGLSDRVMQNPEAADAAEACLWFRETTSAALDLTEPYRSWFMTRFSEGLQ